MEVRSALKDPVKPDKGSEVTPTLGQGKIWKDVASPAIPCSPCLLLGPVWWWWWEHKNLQDRNNSPSEAPRRRRCVEALRAAVRS